MSLHNESSFNDSEYDAEDVEENVPKDKWDRKDKTNDNRAGEEKEHFVEKESRYVFLLRVTVILVLLVAAAAVSIVVFKVTNKAESKEFESDFTAAADKLTETFVSIAQEKIGSAASLEVAIVAHGVDHKRSWPFVTLSSFQQRSSEVMRRSGAVFVGILPVVTHKDRTEWELYSNSDDIDELWYEEGREYQKELGIDDFDTRPQVQTEDPNLDLRTGVANHIYTLDTTEAAKATIAEDKPIYLPLWQTSPVTRRTVINRDFADYSEAALVAVEKHAVVFSGMGSSSPGYGGDSNPYTAEFAWLLHVANRQRTLYEGDIFTNVYVPLFSNFTSNRSTVGTLRVVIHWASYFRDVLPSSTVGIVLVLDNGCDEPYTYMVNGGQVVTMGHGDLHDPKYDKYVRKASFENVRNIADGTKQGLSFYQDQCTYRISVYPSDDFSDDYDSNTPKVITVSVASVFAFMVLMFLVYDHLVEWRQSTMLKTATQTHQIVASLFPKAVRDRMLKEAESGPNQNRLKAFLGAKEEDRGQNEAPIADLFPNATILFADISGFTAWSSSREPSQVFILLQTLYKAFDEIATKRNVFKVETVGDCYVAATGLPNAQNDHALQMTRFAFGCLSKTAEITRELETTLGPDTGDLNVRIGMNSGPVIAGVLRGERSRFQLFGDTVNTAARMESTGVPGRIQVSQSTADILMRHGKGHWIEQRQDDVNAKGKGVLRTYWATLRTERGSFSTSNSQDNSSERYVDMPKFEVGAESLLKQARLVDWMVEILQDYVRQIGIKHKVMGIAKHGCVSLPNEADGIVFADEVVDHIKFPIMKDDLQLACVRSQTDRLSVTMRKQLHEYVSVIASTYRQNSFHSFDHACHVTMNVCKFLKRIVSADNENRSLISSGSHVAEMEYTHEINTDPIIPFAIVFAAMVHDVDHRGVSNNQFINEEPNIAEFFGYRSPLEQNSLAIAWKLLMSDKFRKLRHYLFATTEELKIFRQILVNSVMATDIFDKASNDMRKTRWLKVFGVGEGPDVVGDNPSETNDIKATIVMEYVIQASDVCHTMQHWHVYRKWNKRLFLEQVAAFRAGRLQSDPARHWYAGELKFFDNYVIPLAKKLEQCKVFGVSSDECLNYALRNRAEWEVKGEIIVQEMVEEIGNRIEESEKI